MRKLFIDRQEPLTEIVERIIKLPDQDIRLVIPRNAAISSSSQNFDILKREIETEGKTLSIESVDDVALMHARANDIDAVHPLLMNAGKSLSDIIPGGLRTPKAPPVKHEKHSKKGAKTKEERHLEVHEDDEPEEEIFEKFEPDAIESQEMVRDLHPADEENPTNTVRIDGGSINYSDDAPRRKKWPWVAAILLIGMGVAVWALGNAFAKATVTLEFNKTPWTYNGPVSIKTNETDIHTETKTLPGEVFTENRNMTNLFPVSGRSAVEEKAKGMITIYNAYGPDAQTLVATTRFATPDGTIVRLVDTTIVPGATVKDGKITPSSVQTKIVADKAGDTYNIGPVSKLTIPGFQGTPRYEGFYGTITEKLYGGFIGERAVATEADITDAKDRTREMLTANLTSGVLRNQPADFVVVDGASQVEVTRIAVVSSTAESGDKIGVFGQGSIKAIAFREPDMRSLLTMLARPAESTLVLANLTVGYENPQADFDGGTLTLTVDAKGTLTGEFDESQVKSMLLGKGIGEARNILLTLPDLNHARITLWPRWAKKVPKTVKRITVQAE